MDRELTMDDYLAIVRRRLKVVLLPLLIAPVAGFLISYGFSPRYTSQSTVLVEGQKVPSNYVTSVITADFAQRIQTLQQQVLSTTRLRPMIESLALVRPEDEGKLMEQIRSTFTVTPVITSMSAGLAAGKKKPGIADEPLPGVNVNYSDVTPAQAQKVCNALTNLIVDENLRSRAEVAKGTSDFLARQVEDAKRALDDLDTKLAAFKRQNIGQLPGDIDNNMKMLQSLGSQLDAKTAEISRAQQDKSYTESLLAQQLAEWKNSQSSTSPQTLEQQLSTLQTQLMQLQARYTDDYPDVIKTKADIAKVQAKLDELNKQATKPTEQNDKAEGSEPPEIQRLRQQIHQYQDLIAQDASDQKKLQGQINVFQKRTNMSPTIEEQYDKISRDYANAQKVYSDLLAKKSQADLGTNMENQQQGEQMTILQPANLPDSPSFPNRPIFAAGGVGVGLGLGLLIAIWLELSDRSIRTEKDAAAAMDLPLLISVPWLGEEEETSTNRVGRRSFWGRGSPAEKDREKVEV